MISTTILRSGAVAAGALAATLFAASAAQASGPADPHHRNPGMQRMHELHMQGNPGMQRMHELHMQDRRHGAPMMHMGQHGK